MHIVWVAYHLHSSPPLIFITCLQNCTLPFTGSEQSFHLLPAPSTMCFYQSLLYIIILNILCPAVGKCDELKGEVKIITFF